MFSLPHGDSLLVVGYEAEVIVGTFRITWTVRVQVLYREGRREGFTGGFQCSVFIHHHSCVHSQAFSMQELTVQRCNTNFLKIVYIGDNTV